MEVQVNLIAVLLAAVASMAVGFIWYARPVFGREWQQMVKLSDKEMKEMSWFPMVVALFSSLVMAYVLAHLSFLTNYFFANSFLQDSLMTGLWIWVGFQGVRMFMHDQFENRRKKLSVINAGSELATIMLMALVIGLMRP